MPSVTPLSTPSPSITQTIANQIESLIVEGDLLPAQKIPSERQLCSRLKVSRTAVREALRELQTRNLIITKPGLGSFVAEIIKQPVSSNPFLQLYFDHHRTLYDVYEVREQLEAQAAFLAAQRADKKDLYYISKAYHAIEEADTSISTSRAHLDQQFHKAIVDASHNPVLIHLLASLEELILHSVQASNVNLYHIEAFRKQMNKHHRQIYQAIINTQPLKAQRAAAAHVIFVSKCLKEREQEGQKIIRDGLHNH
ncbi:MAG: GntR family transcriptional activator of glc operon [Oceanospirillaceae bacterium]|jgi:GntR family transcriptional activator of glc operon